MDLTPTPAELIVARYLTTNDFLGGYNGLYAHLTEKWGCQLDPLDYRYAIYRLDELGLLRFDNQGSFEMPGGGLRVLFPEGLARLAKVLDGPRQRLSPLAS